MTITTRDQLIDAMANNSSRIIFDKASIASQTANSFCSFWRGTGQPGQGAIPTTAAVCNDSLLGCIQFAQQTSPATSYLTILEGTSSNASMTMEIHDRLMHMGGLSGTVTTAQTVNLDLDANLATDDLADRIGDSNYSDVQWWLEWYTATGATNTSVTVNVTYNDGTSGNLTATGNIGTSSPGLAYDPIERPYSGCGRGQVYPRRKHRHDHAFNRHGWQFRGDGNPLPGGQLHANSQRPLDG